MDISNITTEKVHIRFTGGRITNGKYDFITFLDGGVLVSEGAEYASYSKRFRHDQIFFPYHKIDRITFYNK